MVVFLVLKTIIENKIINQKQIINHTQLSERTIRNSLKRLLNSNLITETIELTDLRFKFYKLNGGVKNGKKYRNSCKTHNN